MSNSRLDRRLAIGCYQAKQLLRSRASQWLSLYNALLLSALVLLFPQLLTGGRGGPHHVFLALMMFGISTGFVFGVGFVPHNRVLAVLLGPCVGWPLMIASIGWLALSL